MKRTIIIIAVCIAALFAAGIVFAVSSEKPASKQEVNATFIPAEEAEEWLAAQEAQKEALMGKPAPDPEEYLTLYERALLHANAEQKAKLENLDTFGYEDVRPEELTKQIMIIMGMIPADAPRITIEQAEAILESVKAQGKLNMDYADDLIAEEFNKIAGAPDIECGSGLSHRVWFLDEEHTAWIDDCMGIVYYKASPESETVILYPDIPIG